MTTAYEKPYPTYIAAPLEDVADGVHTVASLLKKHAADAVIYADRCKATGTSKFDDGKDNTTLADIL